MDYVSVSEMALRWKVSKRTVRNYCASGQIPGALLEGKTWKIPEDAVRPERKNKSEETLLTVLREEKAAGMYGGIYHEVQIDLTYNSNHMEGNKLTHDQTRYIFETNTIGLEGGSSVRIDDIIESVNHFWCIDQVIDQANRPVSENMIKSLHRTLKTDTSDARVPWFEVGGYKRRPNVVGGKETTLPEDVPAAMKALLDEYNRKDEKTLEDLVEFHDRFESIHPFQDGNGRVGRLLLFKECLRCDIVPFIIDEDFKYFYYRGLSEWKTERGYLLDTCRAAQDKFKARLDYYRIPYKCDE